MQLIDNQIEQFLETGVTEKTTHSKGKGISNIFIRPKKDGPNHRKYLRFKWKNQSSFLLLAMSWEHLNRHQSFQFTCLRNGLSSAPRIFTKLLKPAYSVLPSKGLKTWPTLMTLISKETPFLIVKQIYLPLSGYLQTWVLRKHGKIILIPSKVITFLGFLLNSVQM